MTIPQIQGWMKAIQKRQINNRIISVSDTAIASQADGKAIKKTVKQLEDSRKRA